jgi:hypothetical protein
MMSILHISSKYILDSHSDVCDNQFSLSRYKNQIAQASNHRLIYKYIYIAMYEFLLDTLDTIISVSELNYTLYNS